MKTKTVKKVTVLLTAVLFVFGAASFALAASAKSTGDIDCPLMDKMTLAKLDLTQEQMAKVHTVVCEPYLRSAQSAYKSASEREEWQRRHPNLLDYGDYKSPF